VESDNFILQVYAFKGKQNLLKLLAAIVSLPS